MDELPVTERCDDTAAVERVPLSGLSLTVLFASGTLFVLRESAPFAAPILVSVLLAYALEPLVDAFARCRLHRVAAVLVTYALLAIVLAGGAQLAKNQAVAFLDDLPDTIAAVKNAAFGRAGKAPAQPAGTIQNLQRAAASVEATVNRAVPPARARTRGARLAIDEPFDIRTYLLDAWARAVSTTAQLIVIVVLTFVLLIGGDRVKTNVIEIAGPRLDRQILTLEVIRAIDRQIQRYLVARVAISLIVAGATAAAMWFLGVRQPLVLGAIAGVLNVLPFIGPALAVAICAVVSFIQFHSVESTLAAAVAATVVAALEGNLITPWLTSRAGELNTVAVYVSVLFWGWMWDVWGLLLAIPIMIAMKAAADHIEPLQPFGELLGR